ncbi:hypothetical protein [Bifidobacterium miconisargentati]|uniref:hypothetical protein n=1 Tax=Bifidobacterium miconisargentati TaxID=2834437 RepID=UPI001BDC7265|nr:hypothetical protein [Bifidobacterium miconisargentati]MBW3090090.1 hypothetical protein [Bifidobacterium miconisargentati]
MDWVDGSAKLASKQYRRRTFKPHVVIGLALGMTLDLRLALNFLHAASEGNQDAIMGITVTLLIAAVTAFLLGHARGRWERQHWLAVPCDQSDLLFIANPASSADTRIRYLLFPSVGHMVRHLAAMQDRDLVRVTVEVTDGRIRMLSVHPNDGPTPRADGYDRWSKTMIL